MAVDAFHTERPAGDRRDPVNEPTREVGPPTGSTWHPVDLGPVLKGERKPVRPEILGSEGRTLLYPGKVHAIYGEPEGLKTWIALEACRQILATDGTVFFIDYEDSEWEIVERLRTLGLADRPIAQGFIYVQPTERIRPVRDRVAALVRQVEPSLVVIDGVTEAMTIEGLNLEKNTDVADFYERLPRTMSRLGPAVVMLDHVVKSKDDRGRFAIGGQAKLAGVDGATFRLETTSPFGRGLTGRSKLYVTKDRPGFVSSLAVGAKRLVAEVTAESNHKGTEVSITLAEPKGPISDWKPTWYMERMSRHLEDFPDGLALRVWLQGVDGGREYKKLAISQLIAAGNVRKEMKRNAHIHTSVTLYREPAQDEPPATTQTLDILQAELGTEELWPEEDPY